PPPKGRSLRRRLRTARPSLRVGRWSLSATAGRDGWPPPSRLGVTGTEPGVQTDSSGAPLVGSLIRPVSCGYSSQSRWSMVQAPSPARVLDDRWPAYWCAVWPRLGNRRPSRSWGESEPVTARESGQDGHSRGRGVEQTDH